MVHHISADAPRVWGPGTGAAAPPPEGLLPSGGRCGLAVEAVAGSSDVGFRDQVEAIHRQLLPVRSRTVLASSYGREAGRRSVDGVAGDPDPIVTPLQVAYALRWLELAEPVATERWAALLDGPLD